MWGANKTGDDVMSGNEKERELIKLPGRTFPTFLGFESYLLLRMDILVLIHVRKIKPGEKSIQMETAQKMCKDSF